LKYDNFGPTFSLKNTLYELHTSFYVENFAKM
jgi:hypothetical protein